MTRRKRQAVAVILMLAIPFASISISSRVHTKKITPLSEHLINGIYEKVSRSGMDLSEEVFTLAFTGFSRLSAQGKLSRDSILTIIDYSRSSREKRLFVIDLKKQDLIFNSVVAHGKNSGNEFAKYFSNNENSHQSSLGFYLTGNTYYGSNGYSLRLIGLEKNFNDRALDRAIVIHGASYANEQAIRTNGCLGRSWGCPAVPKDLSDKLIEKIKKGNCLFIYYPDKKYLRSSSLLNS